jgi:hypothetical protein
MEYTNAFIGKATQPTDAEIAVALGPALEFWKSMIQAIVEAVGITAQEWKGVVVKKYGWSLRLKIKGRTIVYLSPGTGCFMVSFVLGDKALALARAQRVPKLVKNALTEATRYPEGNGVRIFVHTAACLPAIRKIAAIKAAN